MANEIDLFPFTDREICSGGIPDEDCRGWPKCRQYIHPHDTFIRMTNPSVRRGNQNTLLLAFRINRAASIFPNTLPVSTNIVTMSWPA